eukprot:TRINITY_DN3644_c0_g1::TRINITY_DN3644_c0_g1_i1::g.9162::m.9162 TRINITY_DN3644_c0_g1::TRINITY_DN3644_c0_g1_i1::g.9162  ORF type:complete len:172 (-),score=11.56,Gly-zipper_OmpA/PF13436.1/1.5,Gly-zipper_OmpA/PF13436.1/0.5,DUF883/PF05957.8/1.9,DUF883/PF05957.8/2.3e+03,DUF883/PF05957.8/2.2e+03,Gly-zipper_Omp/PF13488.1/3.4,Gly-zipper_Omp/PF13488.1/60 TRINITY_DN3644_c0_g1_i1:372-887(-)
MSGMSGWSFRRNRDYMAPGQTDVIKESLQGVGIGAAFGVLTGTGQALWAFGPRTLKLAENRRIMTQRIAALSKMSILIIGLGSASRAFLQNKNGSSWKNDAAGTAFGTFVGALHVTKRFDQAAGLAVVFGALAAYIEWNNSFRWTSTEHITEPYLLESRQQEPHPQVLNPK